MKRRFLPFIIGGLVAIAVLVPSPATAALDSCRASVSLREVTSDTPPTAVFTLKNTHSDRPIRWVRIRWPNAQIRLTDMQVRGWNATLEEDTVAFNLGLLRPGETFNAALAFIAPEATSGDWQVQASDAPDGHAAVNCEGDLSMSVDKSAQQDDAAIADNALEAQQRRQHISRYFVWYAAAVVLLVLFVKRTWRNWRQVWQVLWRKDGDR